MGLRCTHPLFLHSGEPPHRLPATPSLQQSKTLTTNAAETPPWRIAHTSQPESHPHNQQLQALS
ncbi:hypothetical protein MLPF_1044 [Mycobacterium lepromatosis]|nr:hypothetical protein MLPF_1044 [Mycobacterium lepromatosis]